MDLNILKLSVESLLTVLIVILMLQCFGFLKCKGGMEGLSTVDYDKYQAAYNQERDDAIGATPSGDPLNRKTVDSWGEGLVGGSESPAFWDGRDYNMHQTKGAGGVVETTRPSDSVTEGMDPLSTILHGGSPSE